METLVESNWYTVMEETEETENTGETVEGEDQASGDADPAETVDPDFQEVSEILRESETASPKPSETPVSSPETVESIDYIPYFENISVQLGVIDIVLVLALLIFVIKQFVRVPR